MNIHREVFEFAASAGALEGYLYTKENLVSKELDDWIYNLLKQYENFPPEVRDHFQDSLDRTLGRAVHSLAPLLGSNHPHVVALKSMIKGEMPASSHDFDREKEEKATKFGD